MIQEAQDEQTRMQAAFQLGAEIVDEAKKDPNGAARYVTEVRRAIRNAGTRAEK